MKKCRTCGRIHAAKRHIKQRSYKGFKVKSGNVKGGFGETDFGKKTITIDKKKHRKGQRTKNKDGTENKLQTLLHEAMHVKHPKKGEQGVEKLATAMRSKMTKKQKARWYAKMP